MLETFVANLWLTWGAYILWMWVHKHTARIEREAVAVVVEKHCLEEAKQAMVAENEEQLYTAIGPATGGGTHKAPCQA